MLLARGDVVGKRRFRLGSAAVAACAIVLGGYASARAATRTWNGSTGNWNTNTNWSGSTVPGTNDDVVITTGAVTVDSGTNSVRTVSISGGTVAVSGSTTTLTTSGNFTISGGTFTSGTATTNTITIGGDLSISNADASLVGHWKLDESASPAADSSATGASLTWNGSPTSSTSVPTVGFNDVRSLSMTGAQYAASTALTNWSALKPATLTMSAWYKATNVDTSGAEIVSGGNIYALRITASGLSVIKRIAHNGTPTQDWVEYQVAPSGYLDGNWHQIVGVINTNHSITAYFDGTAIAGTYYYNGTGGLTAVSSPPELSALDYGSVGTYGLNIGRNPSTGSFDFGANCAAGACAIDDVRIYNRALSAAEVATLSTGSVPGTFTLSSPLSVDNLTVSSSGTLTLSGANATLTLARNGVLTMDGTLNSSSSASTGPTITVATGVFSFHIGSVNGATPTLNISKLAVSGTDNDGMRINGSGSSNTTATTTFKRFDNIAFTNGKATGSSAFLQIYATSLYLDSQGCSFGAGEAANALPSAAVKLTGNGFTNGATETRAIFGGTTCGDAWTGGGTDKICTDAAKDDNDTGGDGIGDTAGSNGAVVQFVRAAVTDVKGTIEGLPTAAFSWTTFAYYSTYVAYHDADSSGTRDRVYVRQSDGSAATSTYYWEAPAGEAIVGTPRWNTVGSAHYVYVALASGKVYKLVDDTSAHTLSTTGSGWTTNPFTSATTITTPISMDTNNIYFGGVLSGTNNVWALKQSDGTAVTGSPFSVGAVTSAAPAVWTNGSDTMVTVGLNGQITNVDVTNSVMTFSNTAPAGSVTGRIGYGSKTAATLFVADNMGNMLGITPTVSNNTSRWSYSVGASTSIGPSYWDYTSDTLMFGTAAGKLYSITTATGNSVGNSNGFSSGFAPNSNADPINNAPLYVSGIILAGTTGSATNGGKLFIIDRNASTASPCTASGPSVLRQYNFGPSVSVSGVGYDSSSSRYMVTTSSSISDGSLYYVDGITDPSSACN